MNSSNKVAKFHKRKDINMGFIIFFIVFIYVLIRVIIYFTNDHLTIYEVQKGFTSDNNTFNGLILRDEEVISTTKAGYINYYHRDGDRIAKNATIYSIDESKQTSDLIGNKDSVVMSEDNTKEIQKMVSDYHDIYSSSNYSAAYDLKYDLESMALEILNDNMMKNLKTVLNTSGTSNSFHVEKSKMSGLISYTYDNMENLQEDDITAEDFNTDKYKKTEMLSMDLIEPNTPAYRIITDDNWNIILLLDKNEYNKFKNEKTAYINFVDTNLEANVPIKVYKKGSDYFGKLELNKYLEYYENQRYVKVELESDAANGLKIPTSAIVKKDFYKIPLEFFSEGGNSDAMGLNKESYKDGKLEFEFVPTEIYYNDGTYGYVDSRLFELGTKIRSVTSNKQIEINQVDSLDGAYNVNKGYAVFRRIEKVYEDKEYCIIKEGTEYGLSVYDHIALVGSTAVEQDFIN